MGVRHQRRQNRRGVPRDDNGECATGHGEAKRFHENVGGQAARARAKRQPHRQLVLTAKRPGEHQVADIGACHQQNEAHGTEQQQQGAPGVAHQRLAQRQRLVPCAHVLLWELGFELLGQGRHLCGGLIERLARTQAADRVHPAGLPLRRHRTGQRLRHDQVGRRHPREAEAGRQHADDHRPRRPELNRARDRLRIRSELGAPELVANNGHWRGAFARVVVLQQPSQGWLKAQGPQRIRRHAGTLQAHRFATAEERRLVTAEPGQRLERPLTRAQIHEIAQGDIGLRQARLHVTVAKHHEVVGPFERQRPQQRGFDDGEERSVRAYAQGERDDGSGREGRLAVEDPKCLAKFAHLHGCVRRW